MHFAVCFALFEYLTVGLEAAIEIFQRSLHIFKDGEKLHEDILVAYAKLVQRHSVQYPTPPGILRDILIKALEIYPHNYLFINLFIDNEARSQIANRIRTFFSESLTK